MNVTWTPDDLRAFENEIATRFNDKQIRAPIHLYDGCEEQMIQVFRDYVQPDDWVLCSWRSHYQCLLKGVPRTDVLQSILDGKSISLCFPEQRVLSSAIVGGTLPIATGLALGIQRAGDTNKVICFVGEMTSETGIMHECVKYSLSHELPILFVVEDNGKSVCSPTRDVWNLSTLTYEQDRPTNVIYYQYESQWPHAGSGVRINF